MTKKTIFKEGDRVRYWRGKKSGPSSGAGRIMNVGEMGGVPVAWIEGCSGCIALTHIELETDPDFSTTSPAAMLEKDIWAKIAKHCAELWAGNHNVVQYTATFPDGKIERVQPEKIEGIYEALYHAVTSDEAKPYTEAMQQVKAQQALLREARDELQCAHQALRAYGETIPDDSTATLVRLDAALKEG